MFFSYLFDGLDRPVFLFENGVVWHIIVPYTPEGGPSLHLLSNGGIRAFGYDALQRPNALTHLFAASSAVTWTLARNPAGQIASIARDNDAYAWTGAYNTTRPYVTNGLNQYATTGQPNALGSVAFTYDANGNLASEATWNGTAYIVSAAYTYDVENRLVGRSGNVTLSYDPLGRLYEVTGNGNTTRFLYDGDALIAEYDASGAVTRRYAHWFGADVPVVSYQGAGLGQPSQLHADHQGSIVALSSASGNAAVNRYDEYGIPALNSAGQNLNTGRFQYTGQIWLDELGMYYYKARIYSPFLGRFLQTDPIGYQDQYNLYAYVGNDPVNGTDPSGQYECRTQKDCETAQAGINQIRAARDYYRSTAPGSRLPRSESSARALSQVLSSLGRKGDGGVNIVDGDLPGTERGSHNSLNNTITIDSAQIAATGARVGEILGHEGEHYRMRGENNLSDIAHEVRPFAVEHMIGTVPGGSLNPQSSRPDFIRHRLHDYCRGLSAVECGRIIEREVTNELRKPF